MSRYRAVIASVERGADGTLFTNTYFKVVLLFQIVLDYFNGTLELNVFPSYVYRYLHFVGS
jgi:hypothetical protein